MSNREVNARIQFQLDTNAREFKAAILEKWNLAEIIDREFDELNTPRTALLEIDGFTVIVKIYKKRLKHQHYMYKTYQSLKSKIIYLLQLQVVNERFNIFSKLNNKFIPAVQRRLREPLPLRRTNPVEDAHGIRSRWETGEQEYASSSIHD